MQRYAEMLLQGLRERGVEVHFIRPTLGLGRLKPASHGVGKWLGYFDKFILFPGALRRRMRELGPGTVAHICDQGNAMYVRHLRDWQHVITCHDVLAVRSALGHFSQNRVGASGRLYQRLILRGLRRARRVICDSEETRRQLLALGGVNPASASTALIGLNYPYRPLAEAECTRHLSPLPAWGALSGQGFILHVGGNQWYKNRPGVLRIYFDYTRQGGRLPLVMAGKPFTEEMKALLAVCPAGGKVIQVDDVSNEQLNALYSRAECLLFPSLQEGFGWPVLEALASGCRVITTNRAPMTEVGGPVAHYCKEDNEASATLVLQQVLAEPRPVRRSREIAGMEWAGRFNSEMMMTEYLRIYREALLQPVGKSPAVSRELAENLSS